MAALLSVLGFSTSAAATNVGRLLKIELNIVATTSA
jgi:hypothetical protein